MITKINIHLVYVILLLATSCKGHFNTKKSTMSTSKNNPLLCDPETGVCEIPNTDTESSLNNIPQEQDKKTTIVYFTDPICSSCWGIEPQLRKLKLEYGNYIHIDYRMGGLLPNWSYNSGGISKPSDVAHHWDEVSLYYQMPIDGDVWLEDPLDSSYPPSIAFKAAQMQDKKKAILFLREIREMVFLQKKNITKWEHISTAAKKVDLNTELLKKDFESEAKTMFQNDLKLAKEYGVRGFPTIFFIDTNGTKELVYGSRPYQEYENALLKVNPTIKKSNYNKNWNNLFSHYNSLTAKEFSELSSLNLNETNELLDNLTKENKLEKFTTKNGSIWYLKN